MASQLSNNKNDYTEKQRIMREPFMEEFPDHLQKLRRNLLVMGSASIVYKISEATLTANGSLLGVSYENLKSQALEWVLIAVLVYLLIHFGWAAVEHFHKWQLRHTGIEDQKIDYNGGDTPYPEDISQYTLYNWWLEENTHIQARISKFKQVDEELRKILEILKDQTNEGPSGFTQSTIHEIDAIKEKIEAWLKESDQRFLSAQSELVETLKRFDTKFWRYQKSRVLRFFIIEYGLPVVSGIVGIAMLCCM